MTMRTLGLFLAAIATALALNGCGGSTTPTQPPPVVLPPPVNAMPSVTAITVQGKRPRQPARFADAAETIDVSATVTDAETPVDELTYEWTAAVGTFSGTGRNVTWTAPADVPAPIDVTLTLKVTERYGHPGQPKDFSQNVSATQTLSLHDSRKEVGDMSVRFLTEFSKPQTNKDWRDIMRDFKATACPKPSEVDSERVDVENHYNNFFMNTYRLDAATTVVNFGGSCNIPKRDPLAGDACASVPVLWDSTEVTKTPSIRRTVTGVDYLAAAYAPADRRWWLCASQFIDANTFGSSFYSR
ncbi:MAG: hypothetical protein ABIS06_07990 [Vicinamibacterales bacterium]